jgi:DNA polymerase
LLGQLDVPESEPPKPEPGHKYPELPETKGLGAWRDAAAHCQACDLWKKATQTVFGEGRRTAKAVFVGEQPGDKEDIAGKPFVGPAGRVLDEALEAAGIDRGAVYVTNAVERFTPLHAHPGARALAAVGHR